jgi:signal transduction histidine kinase
LAQVSNERDPKKLQPITIPKIIEQLERALNNIKYNQTEDSELTFNQIDNESIYSKNRSRTEFIGKELMLFEMIGVLNGKITELQKKYDKIKILEEREEEFVSEESNKIIEPIQDIVDFAKLAKSGQMEHMEAWNKVLEITNRLQNISTTILDTNRIANNSLKLFTKKQNINEIILECISVVKQTSQKIPIHVGLDHNIEIKVDKFRLEQVIKTILINAVMQTDVGHIKVESFVAHDQNLFIIRIFDTGKGISNEKIERIFEKNLQNKKIVENSSSKLSLNLCKGIIEAHGGKIFAKNNADHGCTFTITLPIK